MTPAEKANKLYNSYLPFVQRWDDFKAITIKKENAKQCALIAVNEILEEKELCHVHECYGYEIEYWAEVKQEIQKL